MANIIPNGAGAAVSADIAVAAGAPVNVHGYPASPDVQWTAQIQIKNADNSYTTLAGITNNKPSLVIYGPGTYRVNRLAQPNAFAVDNG